MAGKTPALQFSKQSLMPPAAPRYHENARSALESGPKAVAAATALQGAFGTTIFKAESQCKPGLAPRVGVERFRGPANLNFRPNVIVHQRGGFLPFDHAGIGPPPSKAQG